MAVDSHIQVAPESTGKKIRNRELVVVDPTTGAQDTVECQVVVLASPEGKLVDLTTITDVLVALTELVGEMRDLLGELVKSDTRQALQQKGGRARSSNKDRRAK